MVLGTFCEASRSKKLGFFYLAIADCKFSKTSKLGLKFCPDCSHAPIIVTLHFSIILVKSFFTKL